MKIGILTYHAAYNFGANLQALSTFSYLRKVGHEPIIIDFTPKLLEEAFDKLVSSKQANIHKKFLEKHFVLTKRCRDASGVAKEIEVNQIQSVIIGSDAVVQHYPLLTRIRLNLSRKRLVRFYIQPIQYDLNFPNPFWAEFMDYLEGNISTAMMSVSCQNTDYKFIIGKTKKLMYEAINKLSYISVRDRRTQDLFKHISDQKITPAITPDPVFAFNKNVIQQPSKEEIINKFNLPDNYILLSFHSSKTVSNDWIDSFKVVSQNNGYNCVALTMPKGINFENNLDYKVDIPLDPIDWYCIIKYSSGYIGENMHPIIVSLHNSVPIFSFDNYGIIRFKFFIDQSTSKIYHILDKANLLGNRVSINRRFFYTFPSPEDVFNKLISFDKQQNNKFSDLMLREYEKMMQQLLNKLQNNIDN